MRFFKKPTVLVNVLLPVFLAVVCLNVYQNGLQKAADIGLGKGTSPYFPVVNGQRLHIRDINLADTLVRQWETAGRHDLYLWYGNSQLHGINQYQEGEKNCIHFCFDSLLPRSRNILGISYPNANLQELLVSILYFDLKFDIVQGIVLPVFYDDMREDGIRNEIATDSVREFLSRSGIEMYFSDVSSIKNLIASGHVVSQSEMKALDQTAQEATEKRLNDWVNSSWRIWANRAEIRSNLFNNIYTLRNEMFGIRSSTVRKMIPQNFKNNYTALQNILKYCRDKKIPIILYIPPLRNDVSPPYDPEEYLAFKSSMENKATEYGAIFLNLENIVPAGEWGARASITFGDSEEIDFMHFKEAGHRILADTIYKTIVKGL